MGKRFGMKEVGEDEDWSLFWTDYSVALERCMDMKRYQVWIVCLCLNSIYISHTLLGAAVQHWPKLDIYYR